MLHLLNLLAASALLVWGTHSVRAGLPWVPGANRRRWLASRVTPRLPPLPAARIGRTPRIQPARPRAAGPPGVAHVHRAGRRSSSRSARKAPAGKLRGG